MRKSIDIGAPLAALTALALLSACGGGGVDSTPTPSPTPSPAPTPTPTPAAINYDTTEYDNSSGPVAHGAITAYEAGASGADITVGIIDTGIALNNAEFTGRISSASATFNGEASVQDVDGHGTAVATVLAGARNNQKTLGMAWGATIMALRTDDLSDCDADGCTHSTLAIRQALNHAVSNGASVVNISLGGDGADQGLINAVNQATAAGVIIVISAGNDSAAAPDGFATSLADPSISHGLVIIATSSNTDGAHSSFANGAQGYENVTLSALGEGVRAQDQTGTEYLWDGTSLSAPQVAGAIALMLDAFPNLTPRQVVDRLLATAQDSGDTGPDALFGMGILDIAAAFAPAGATTLGSSKTPLSLADNGALSSAMGDAGGSAGAQAVAIDALGRAYRVELQRTLTPGAPRAVLTPLHSAPSRGAALSLGAFSGAISFTDTAPRFDRFGDSINITAPRSVSGHIAMRLSPDLSVGMALRQQGQDMAALLGDTTTPNRHFLAAQTAGTSLGFTPLPDFAMALNHRLSPRLNLSLSGENGALDDSDALRPSALHETRHYQTISATFGWNARPVSLSLSVSMLNENNSLLGARLASFFGVTSGRTLFADARSDIALPGHWSLALAARRGWTGALHGGHADIRTFAWSADIGRTGLLHRQDRFGLRLAQPLRVVSGGIDALLPVTQDYATGQSTWQLQRINLSPSGREIDAEISYARSMASGWLSLNGYMRRQPGHIARASNDIGGAIRFTVGY
tara:strand:- start:13446 stop:15692 length:2247 start_codon:yes stop_codon:yes gene_type:complete